MQPPTRWARRNGSGIAPGRKRGGTDGASAGTADGAGHPKGRPNKNPGSQTRTGLQEAGRQRCHQGFGCHRRRERGQHFCRGSEPNVHRFDCPGGGPFCAACCRAWFSHSRLQETSAGRNLITLFMTVNNPAYFFFGPLARNAAPMPPRARSENARAHRRVRHAFRSTSLKPKRGAAFSALAFFLSGFSNACASRAKRVANDSDGLYRKKKFPSATAADFASHKPDCAKVRELFSAASGARDRRGGRRCGRSRRCAGERCRRRADARSNTAERDATMRERSRPRRHDRSSVANADACLPRTSRSHSTARAGNVLPVGENSAAGGQRRRAVAEPVAANRAAHARVVVASRRVDRLRAAASATRKWRRDSRRNESRGDGAARRIGEPRRPSPGLHARRRPSRAAGSVAIAIASPCLIRARRWFALRAAGPRATRWRSCVDNREPNRHEENRRSFLRFARARIRRRMHARYAADALRRADARRQRRTGPSSRGAPSRAVGASRAPVRSSLAALVGEPARRPTGHRRRRV